MKEIVKTTTPIEEKVKINSFDELNDSNAKNPPAKPIIEFREHYWRFIDLAIYLLVNLQVGTTINVLSSISEEIEDVYGIELYLVVLSGTSLFVARFITTTVNFFILERLGLRKAILIASLFVAIGTGFRLLIHYHWVFILIGQFFCGFGGVFALNSQMRFCKNWIHPTKIHLYFPLVGLIPFVGIAITSILPEIFFSGD
ncbi:MAG: hypothetical protein GY823_07310 [Flavobacteriaceae bacterium]|nr:hypothetical protein [Flavobacteriaceae bacterium]